MVGFLGFGFKLFPRRREEDGHRGARRWGKEIGGSKDQEADIRASGAEDGWRRTDDGGVLDADTYRHKLMPIIERTTKLREFWRTNRNMEKA